MKPRTDERPGQNAGAEPLIDYFGKRPSSLLMFLDMAERYAVREPARHRDGKTTPRS